MSRLDEVRSSLFFTASETVARGGARGTAGGGGGGAKDALGQAIFWSVSVSVALLSYCALLMCTEIRVQQKRALHQYSDPYIARKGTEVV
jgi:hypothetical protein